MKIVGICWQNWERQKQSVQKTWKNPMNFENENKKHTTVDVLRNKHFYWPCFLVYFSDGFVIYSHAIWNEKKRYWMCAWYTPFTAHNAALEIDILNFNAKVEWTNALYHIMSNRKANSLTISTLLVRNSIGYRNWCCCCIYHTFTNCT